MNKIGKNQMMRFISVVLVMAALLMFASCSLKGPQGEPGEQGAGIESAYINASSHLILVLTDGQKIDAGYIGGMEACTVTFDWNCEDPELSEPTKTSVIQGALLTLPAVPEREGAEFLGWYKDKECTELFDTSKPISASVKIYAGWSE